MNSQIDRNQVIFGESKTVKLNLAHPRFDNNSTTTLDGVIETNEVIFEMGHIGFQGQISPDDIDEVSQMMGLFGAYFEDVEYTNNRGDIAATIMLSEILDCPDFIWELIDSNYQAEGLRQHIALISQIYAGEEITNMLQLHKLYEAIISSLISIGHLKQEEEDRATSLKGLSPLDLLSLYFGVIYTD